jgi:hypothetical protein
MTKQSVTRSRDALRWILRECAALRLTQFILIAATTGRSIQTQKQVSATTELTTTMMACLTAKILTVRTTRCVAPIASPLELALGFQASAVQRLTAFFWIAAMQPFFRRDTLLILA